MNFRERVVPQLYRFPALPHLCMERVSATDTVLTLSCHCTYLLTTLTCPCKADIFILFVYIIENTFQTDLLPSIFFLPNEHPQLLFSM